MRNYLVQGFSMHYCMPGLSFVQNGTSHRQIQVV